jgi:hypothetical protein
LGGGQEPLWPYLTALSTAIFGQIPLALRLPAALVGILTVAAAYPLLLKLFAAQKSRDRYLIALFTALGLALSDWHLLQLSRLPASSRPFFYPGLFCFLEGHVTRSEVTWISDVEGKRFTFYLVTRSFSFFTALAIYSIGSSPAMAALFFFWDYNGYLSESASPVEQ